MAVAIQEIVKEDPSIQDLLKEIIEDEHKLILYNDDFNTFEWVIECLMKVCNHTQEQAEQCAWIVHTKGKYAVLHGSEDFLIPRKRALLERGLTAEVQ
jgi:ATP-dependent Clp protease adaptor protein ClpS